ncbi:hypothetical protein [Pseudomonas aeruginosa]|uniref:hypothetical protein n=1 Tax=Pseudomonas aeruginosa TaxID=287 RepID=UPI0021AD764E|nr:hypothetical protein [Pseudomonas aeruginosa]
MSERYRVEQTGKGFWPYCVRAGNGTRDLYVGHKKTCDRVAAELTTAFRDGEFVGKGLYDALAAEAQALRDERDSQQRVAIKAMEELAALRARVVVTPDASTVYAVLDARERLFTSPENIQVALEAQSRLNGKTVSEGLLRSALTHAHNRGYLAGHHDTVEAQFSHILSSELDSYRSEQVEDILQALLGEGKEHE